MSFSVSLVARGLRGVAPLSSSLFLSSSSSSSVVPSYPSSSPSFATSSFSSLSQSRLSLSTPPSPSPSPSLFSSRTLLSSPAPSLLSSSSSPFSFARSYSTSDDVVIEVTTERINTLMQEKGTLVLYCTADWCGPCKKLGPRLEKDVRSVPGVRLGKIDIDKEQQLAGAMRIQSIPAVFLFHDGKLVNNFVGVPPDEKYNEFLATLKENAAPPAEEGEEGPDPEKVLKEAEEQLEEGKVEEAAKIYSEVFEKHNSKDDDLFGAISLAGLVQCVIKQGELEAAKSLVSNLKSKYKACLEHPSVRVAITTFDLMSSASSADSSSHSIEELEKIVAEDPTKMEEKLDLAKLYFATNQPEASIKTLIDMIKRDRHWNENAAKEQLLKIFEVLGPTHELTVSGRRRLTSVWF